MLTHCTFVSHHTHVLWRHKSTHSHSTRHCHMCQTQDTSNACRTKQRWQAFDRGETHADIIAKVTCTVPKQCHKLTQSQRIISETHALQIHSIWIRKNYHRLRPAVSEILHTHTTGLEILLTDHDLSSIHINSTPWLQLSLQWLRAALNTGVSALTDTCKQSLNFLQTTIIVNVEHTTKKARRQRKHACTKRKPNMLITTRLNNMIAATAAHFNRQHRLHNITCNRNLYAPTTTTSQLVTRWIAH